MKKEELSNKAWKTAGARFNAYRRLKAKNAASIFFISMLSLVCIFINLFEVFPADHRESASLIFSVLVIIVSLVESSKDYSLKADRLHANALEINSFIDRLKFMQSVGKDEIEEYHGILRSCPENHEIDDLKVFMMQHRKEFFPEDSCFIWSIRFLSVWGTAKFKAYSLYIAICFIVTAVLSYSYMSGLIRDLAM
ncbi:SLATT domain-containing protein [Thalassospira lucentensis]|uniref:SLATT domain-containing protein n=1 Tax=Thalassospira lucentensis TaxID=168935 RepID=UPI00142E2A6A|nr:SLATT domain-containing protein [Thalassospira lucentensis]NIZ01904.1 SLATT domain-containing protein [Thalassospira lucentensis]